MNKLRTHLLFLIPTLVLSVSSTVLAGGDATAGKAKTAMCGACHGTDGNSPANTFPKLAGLGEKYLLKQLLDIKSGARPIVEMTGMLNAMSEQDLADIAAYYDAQPRTLAGSEDKPAQLTLGEKVYRAGNLETQVPACTGCHSPAGLGNTPAGYPALGGQHAAYIAKQLYAFRDGFHDQADPSGRRNDESAVMRGVAARMSDQEIEALANYIAGLSR